jgi:hypothetical protein
MKKCTKCYKTKPLEEFAKSGEKRKSRCKSCHNEYYKEYYKDPERYGKHKERIKNNRYAGSRYGMSREDWEVFIKRNNGMCEICSKRKATCVDHDHVTGEVRGRLCTSCNVSIGQLGDTVESLQKVVNYLTKSPYQQEVNNM